MDNHFLIWQYGLEELNKFVYHLNSRTESMKFTMEVSREEISFLDTTVKRRDRTLQICFVNQLTRIAIYYTVQPILTTVRIASLMVSSYGADRFLAIYQILPDMDFCLTQNINQKY